LHAHTQLLGKLDLHAHEAVAQHSDNRAHRVALVPDRPVGDVTRRLLAAVGDMTGPFEINLTPQETPWSTPLDEDDEHATYDAGQVASYVAAATRAALVLAALRAPYRGRSTPVNAWWGSFDLAVSLFSGLPADPPADDFIMRNAMDAQEVAVGWWPGDARYPKPALLGLRAPRGRRLRLREAGARGRTLGSAARRVRPGLGRHRRPRRPARGRARFRPLGVPARVRRVRLGSGAGRQRGGDATPDELTRRPNATPPSHRG